jgi:single-stranded-DNA-specific exonuclease
MPVAHTHAQLDTPPQQTPADVPPLQFAAPATLVELKPADPAPRQSIRAWNKRWTGRLAGRSALPLVERVLLARGISGPAAETFLNPKLSHLHDASLMPGLDRAAQRLLDAARAAEPIVIYGDYDVDGVSATAILYHTLRTIAPDANVQTYVPHRLDEGYGLNPHSIAELCAGGAKVIVSVDCGITAIAPAKVAKDAGVDLIITDHHNLASPEVGLPDAFALVHPRLACDQPYPFGELCGAGVAFKLAWKLMTLAAGSPRLSEAWRLRLLDMLALASMGVIADIVPLVGENRVMARFGLSRLRSVDIEGLRALVEASNLEGEKVREEDVGFKLGPRLNACGRMGHAKEAVELLTTASGARAIELAQQLSRQNEARRALEKEIFEHACDLAQREGMTSDDRRAIVLAHHDWHPGVVGIVCSRLVEKFCRPAILMRDHESTCHGSGRSVEGVSLHAALTDCREHLAQFGGHDMAAGLKLDSSRLPAFQSAFIDAINARLPATELVAKARYDTGASLDEVTVDAVTQLQSLAPFGRDNPPVRLRVVAATIAQRPTLMGKQNQHLAFVASSPRGRMLRCVAWNAGAAWVERLRAGMRVELFATPRVNEWKGNRSAELEVADIAEAS